MLFSLKIVLLKHFYFWLSEKFKVPTKPLFRLITFYVLCGEVKLSFIAQSLTVQAHIHYKQGDRDTTMHDLKSFADFYSRKLRIFVAGKYMEKKGCWLILPHNHLPPWFYKCSKFNVNI